MILEAHCIGIAWLSVIIIIKYPLLDQLSNFKSSYDKSKDAED